MSGPTGRIIVPFDATSETHSAIAVAARLPAHPADFKPPALSPRNHVQSWQL